MLRKCSALIAALLLAAPLATKSQAQLFRKAREKAAAAKQSAQDSAPASPRNRSASVLLRNGIDYLETYKDPERALQYLKEAQTYQRELSEKERWQLSQAIERASRMHEAMLARRQTDHLPSSATDGGPTRRRMVASVDPAQPMTLPDTLPDAKADRQLQTTGGTTQGSPLPLDAAASSPATLENAPLDVPDERLHPAQPVSATAQPGTTPSDTIGLTIISQPDEAPAVSSEPTQGPKMESTPSVPARDLATPATQPSAPVIVADPLDVPENRQEQPRTRRSDALQRTPQMLEEIKPSDANLPQLPLEEPTAEPARELGAVTVTPVDDAQPPAAPPLSQTTGTSPAPSEPSEELRPAITSPVEEPMNLPQLPEAKPKVEDRNSGAPRTSEPPVADSLPDLPSPPPAVRQPATHEADLPPLPAAATEIEERSRPESLREFPSRLAQIRPGSDPEQTERVEVHNPASLREVEELARRQDDELRQNPPARRPSEPLDDTYQTETDSAPIPRAPSPTEARPINPIPVPEEYVPLEKRVFQPYRKNWAAAATCHMPLYFQDAVLERYGQDVEQALGPRWGRCFSYPLDDPRQTTQRNQLLQPAYSAGLFIVQMAAWPFNVVMNPPWEAEYDLGYYRPGDPVPPDSYYWPKLGVGPPLRGRQY